MEILNSEKFQLIKRDARELKRYIVHVDEINDWDKIIVVYNIVLLFSNMYYLYNLLEYLSKDKMTFREQFIYIYVFFFCLCSMKDSYVYFIKNVSRIDPNLALSFHQNLHEYFDF